jgi:hypothetical protein
MAQPNVKTPPATDVPPNSPNALSSPGVSNVAIVAEAGASESHVTWGRAASENAGKDPPEHCMKVSVLAEPPPEDPAVVPLPEPEEFELLDPLEPPEEFDRDPFAVPSSERGLAAVAPPHPGRIPTASSEANQAIQRPSGRTLCIDASPAGSRTWP